MKLYYVDQFNKVQVFNGTDEEKKALYEAGNLYHDEWFAYEATQGRKIRYTSSYIFRTDILDKWTLTRRLTPIQVVAMGHIEEWDILSFKLLKKDGLLFDTKEEAEVVSDKLRAVLRAEAERRASTPKQSQALQGGQHQPCSEERQSRDECSCEHTKSNSECRCHEQGHPCSQGRTRVTWIEIVL